MSDYLLGQPDLSPGLSGVPVEDAQNGGQLSVAQALAKQPDTSEAVDFDALKHLGDVFTTARKSDEVNSGILAQGIAVQEAAEQRNARIQAATGVQLDNPYRRAPITGTEIDDPNASAIDKAALQSYAAAHPEYYAGEIPPAGDQAELDGYRADAWRGLLGGLAKEHPDQASIIGADAPIEPEAAALANSRGAAASQAYGEGGAASLAANLGGGAAAMRRDPIQMAGILFGGVEAAGAKVLDLLGSGLFGRMIAKGVGQGLTNAGLQAAEEPTTQAWRASLGQESGFIPALKDIGFAGLFGLIPGAAHEAAAGLFKAAIGGSREAAAELAQKMPATVAPELHAAIASDAADRAAPDPPAMVKPADAAQAYREAVRFGEDPANNPLPEPAPAVSEGVTDAPARAIAERSPDPFAAVAEIRRDPATIESALSSDDPNLQTMGRLAELSDDGLARVRNGEVDPLFAQHVSALIADPNEHGAALDELAHFRPVDEMAARQIISDRARLMAYPDASQAMLGEATAPAAREVPLAIPRETPAQRAAHRAELETGLKGEAAAGEGSAAKPKASRAPKPLTLLAFLKRAGGVKDEGGELKALDLVRSYPGLVNNKRGLSLDMARRTAAEAGYLGPHISSAMADTTVADFLDAVADHPRFAIKDEGEVNAGREREANRIYDERLEGEAQRIDAHLKENGEPAADREWRSEAAQLLVHGEAADPGDALERAAIMLYERDAEQAAAHRGGHLSPEIDHEAPFLTDSLDEQDRPFSDVGPSDRDGSGEEGDFGPAQEPVRDGSAAQGEGGQSLIQPRQAPERLIDAIPTGFAEDGADYRAVSRAELLAEKPRAEQLANLMRNCPL